MIVYVCSRHRADTEEQFKLQEEYTKEIAKALVINGHDVIVPHLYYTRFLDDNIKVERRQGMRSALRLIKICNLLLVNTMYGISEGMQVEIELARKGGIWIREVSTIEQVKKI